MPAAHQGSTPMGAVMCKGRISIAPPGLAHAPRHRAPTFIRDRLSVEQWPGPSFRPAALPQSACSPEPRRSLDP